MEAIFLNYPFQIVVTTLALIAAWQGIMLLIKKNEDGRLVYLAPRSRFEQVLRDVVQIIMINCFLFLFAIVSILLTQFFQ